MNHVKVPIIKYSYILTQTPKGTFQKVKVNAKKKINCILIQYITIARISNLMPVLHC